MKNADYLEAFTDYLVEEEKSEGTVSGYKLDVKDFMKFIGKDIKKVVKTDVTAYKEHLRSRKLQTLSINRKLVSIKQFIDFVNDRFELGLNARIRQEKVQKQYSLKDDELLLEEDYSVLIGAVEAAGDIRSKAMFEAMYYSGMRVSEMLQLRIDHVTSDKKVINDIKGKGGKYRPIFISDKLKKSLKTYLEVRKQPFSSTTKALFTSERGPVSRQTVHNDMKKYAKAAGIELSKAHAHNLRHLFCLNLADKGFQIHEIAKYAGHTNIEVTRRYVEKPESHYIQGINRL